MRRNIVQEFLSEYVNYGGLAATRAQVYEHAIACGKACGASESSQHRTADRACCAYEPLTSEQAARMARFDPDVHG